MRFLRICSRTGRPLRLLWSEVLPALRGAYGSYGVRLSGTGMQPGAEPGGVMRTAIKWGTRILFLLLCWACVVLLFLAEGCSRGYTERTQGGGAWAAAWACRCDSCCQILDELEAEREAEQLDALEGAQI